ncbi:MAG TPA: fatty acid desaturase [Steroidobacteraceae bacterium]|nr:fatty acid desaturase [Steroidobacteraceae bacterium]
MRRLFRRPGAWPHVLVIGYTVLGWPLGIWMLLRPELLLNAAGVLLTAHTLVCTGYLLHDCAHHSIFLRSAANDRLGILMSWINGACLASYDRLKRKHLQHHADRLDVVTFNYRAALKAAPVWVRRSVLLLEWAYIPAVELIMRGMIVAAPFRFERRGERLRMILLLGVRVVFFAAFALLSIKGVLLYALAYLLFLTVLRFMDAFQHTYEVFVSPSLESAPVDPRRDRRYEYLNTYSNLVSERWWILNLLVLNFSYHNAHHARPSEAWYRLPALHRSLYRAADQQVITCRELLASFHRHRLARVLSDEYGEVAPDGARARGFRGAVGVSFLTAV